MAKAAKVAWGIDVGNCTLKAIKIGIDGDQVELLDFAVIEHETILSQSEINAEQRRELINAALNKFLQEHPVENTPVVVAVPGQTSFARFIKLPLVERKRIPEIVKFEAMQQIPFDIDDVEWDWQTFQEPENPDIEVGIFAIKKELVGKALEPFIQNDCQVSTVQMAPMALYNCIRHDSKMLQDPANTEAIITLDIGAENTDLVIAEGQRVWQRSIPIGGNHFTAAIQKAFKLGFSKAEAIKRTANTSKYARQIFQAMRSVFADLAGEIQRSLGFYSSGHRDVEFRQVLALGNAVKLPGLLKFLQQSLSLPVKRLDSFDSLKISPDVSVAQFTENLSSLAVAYGLALQEVGLGAIQSNLLPREVARLSLWKRKKRWFAIAAAVVLAASFLNLFKAYSQRADIQEAQQSVRAIENVDSQIRNQLNTRGSADQALRSAAADINKRFEPFQKRNVLPHILRAIRQRIPNIENVTDPAQRQMLEAYINGEPEGVMAIPRLQRDQIFLTSVEVIYTDDLSKNFDTIITSWSNRRVRERAEEEAAPGAVPGMMGFPGMGFPGMGFPGGGFPGAPSGGQSRERKRSSSTRDSGDKVEGFVVVIEGYTPNGNNFRFLRPPEAGIDRSKWGFFHQLQFLGKTDQAILSQRQAQLERIAGENKQAEPLTAAQRAVWQVPENEIQAANNAEAAALPFETYIDPETDDVIQYFDATESNWVTNAASEGQPDGIGILYADQSRAQQTNPNINMPGSARATINTVRVDPLTYEPISITYRIDDQGNTVYENGQPVLQRNDYWFRIRMKIRLKS